jgi:predicted Fe-Mo cluster-binding NifX family protein
MKAALPVNNNSMETSICPSFGRAPYFLIYNTETKESVFIDNSAVASQGGAGIKAAQMIVDQGAEVLITPRCGENAAEVINTAGIKIYKAINDSVQDTIKAFTEGRLSLLEDIHPGFHNHGGK